MQYFSFVTDPLNHPCEYYFLDWEYRKDNLNADDAGSHAHICTHHKLYEDFCNKYEHDPLTGKFTLDMINAKGDDREASEKWVRRLDFKTIVPSLIIKSIINPL